MPYPGGKGAPGIYQRIINEIPSHDVYIETHLGGGTIAQKKRPALVNIGIDLDPVVVARWQALPHPFEIHETDAARFLRAYEFKGSEFVYCDPPYLARTRSSDRPFYRFEYSVEQHVELLNVLLSLPCSVMISGYTDPLYDESLRNWRRETIDTRDRSGAHRTEVLWMNYQKPGRLHDYNFLGDDYRDRQRIKRKLERWEKGFLKLPELERRALLQRLERVSDRDRSPLLEIVS